MAIFKGTKKNDKFKGTAGADTMTGLEGTDTLTGLGGNDVLDGGAGTDTMIGGLGDDSYYIDVAADVVTEAAGAGTDTIFSSITATNRSGGRRRRENGRLETSWAKHRLRHGRSGVPVSGKVSPGCRRSRPPRYRRSPSAGARQKPGAVRRRTSGGCR